MIRYDMSSLSWSNEVSQVCFLAVPYVAVYVKSSQTESNQAQMMRSHFMMRTKN